MSDTILAKYILSGIFCLPGSYILFRCILSRYICLGIFCHIYVIWEYFVRVYFACSYHRLTYHQQLKPLTTDFSVTLCISNRRSGYHQSKGILIVTSNWLTVFIQQQSTKSMSATLSSREMHLYNLQEKNLTWRTDFGSGRSLPWYIFMYAWKKDNYMFINRKCLIWSFSKIMVYWIIANLKTTTVIFKFTKNETTLKSSKPQENVTNLKISKPQRMRHL